MDQASQASAEFALEGGVGAIDAKRLEVGVHTTSA